MHCGFMDSRLRRFPPDRASAVPYGQTVDNAARCPPLAHRSAAAHKLHSARSNRYKIRESQNQNPGTGLSLFLPDGCPNDRDHRSFCRSYFGFVPETRWLRTVLTAQPTSAAMRRRVKPCFLNTSISIYTSFVITGASNPPIFSQLGVSTFNRWPVSIYIRR